MKGKRTALLTGCTGLAFLLLAGFAVKDRLREEWYLSQLESEDVGRMENAVQKLAVMRSPRAAARLKAKGAWPYLLSLYGIETENLTHGSRLIRLAENSGTEVEELLGAPTEKATEKIIPPVYGEPKSLPPIDQQWIYAAPMTHLYIYLFQGKVVLAVEEWSDF